MVCVLVVPTTTLPKLADAGVIVSPGVWGLTPAPVRAICVGEFVALLTTETDPVSAPDAVGVKTTLNVAL
jgi:hypothetical protein